MKVAVTSSGDGLGSPIDPRFGRAAKFILVDTETGSVQVEDNTQNLNAAQGAGIQAAQNVSRLGAQVLLTGHCGPKAFATLRAAGIQVITGVEGTVGEVVERFKRGELSPSDSPDVEGHWV